MKQVDLEYKTNRYYSSYDTKNKNELLKNKEHKMKVSSLERRILSAYAENVKLFNRVIDTHNKNYDTFFNKKVHEENIVINTRARLRRLIIDNAVWRQKNSQNMIKISFIGVLNTLRTSAKTVENKLFWIIENRINKFLNTEKYIKRQQKILPIEIKKRYETEKYKNILNEVIDNRGIHLIQSIQLLNRISKINKASVYGNNFIDIRKTASAYLFGESKLEVLETRLMRFLNHSSNNKVLQNCAEEANQDKYNIAEKSKLYWKNENRDSKKVSKYTEADVKGSLLEPLLQKGIMELKHKEKRSKEDTSVEDKKIETTQNESQNNRVITEMSMKEMDNIADKLYKLFEKRMKLDRQRRGL